MTGPSSGEAAIENERQAVLLVEEAANLGSSVAKMVAKAAQPDPDKQVTAISLHHLLGLAFNRS